MSKEIYLKLREFMDTMPAGYPTTGTGVEMKILKKLFTPDDAEIVMKLNIEPEEISAIADRLGIDEPKLTEQLENMALNGLIFRTRSENKVFYNAHSFMVGIYEFRFDHLDREFCELFEEYLPQYSTPLAFLKTNQIRTIPIELSVESQPQLESYNSVREIIKKEELISLQECICRKEQLALGKECKFPKETCIGLGDFAQYYIDGKWGKQIDVDQALKILDQAEDLGLVISSLNTQKLEVVCCCCPCCCPYMRYMKILPTPADVCPPPYQAEINTDLCTSCGICIERCQVKAIKEGEDVTDTVEGRCIGCGICIPTCPEDAISMVPNPAWEKPPVTMKDMFSQVGKERHQLKLD